VQETAILAFQNQRFRQFSGAALKGMQAIRKLRRYRKLAKNQYVMVGWTDPPGQPNLIGKAQYDFYVVKLDAPKLALAFQVYNLSFTLLLCLLFCF